MQIGSLPMLNQFGLSKLVPTGGAGEMAGLPGAGQAGGINPAEALTGLDKAEGTKKSGFSNLLDGAISEVNGKMQAADAEKTKLLSGDSTNVHQAMIAMQEAGVAFSLMVEVRNKLVESYQEIMRMQV